MTLELESAQDEKPPYTSSSRVSSSIMACTVSSPPSSTLIGDYIGIESCLDLKNNEDVFTTPPPPSSPSSKREEAHESCSQRRCKTDQLCSRKEFPPPIPLLARTENLHSHMPWVLKRYYTSDGRLILREEKVRHHEYFRAHRCNGRLTLHLVPLEDDGFVPPLADDGDHYGEEKEEEEEEKEEEDEQGNDNGGVEIDDCVNDVGNNEIIKEDILCKDQRVPVVESGKSGIGTGIGGNGSATGKCLSYNSVRTSSTSIFGVPVSAVRPVHS